MAWAGVAPTGAASTPDYYVATSRAEQKLTDWVQHWTSEDVFFWDRIQTTSCDAHLYDGVSALSSAPFSATVRRRSGRPDREPARCARPSHAFLAERRRRICFRMHLGRPDPVSNAMTVPEFFGGGGQYPVRDIIRSRRWQPGRCTLIGSEIEYARRLTVTTIVASRACPRRVGLCGRQLLTQTVTVLDVTDRCRHAPAFADSRDRWGRVHGDVCRDAHAGARYMVAGEKRGSSRPKSALHALRAARFFLGERRTVMSSSRTSRFLHGQPDFGGPSPQPGTCARGH